MTLNASADVEVALRACDQLGEGPFWDSRRSELLRVDISAGVLHGWRPSTGKRWRHRFNGEIGAAIPRRCNDGWIVAVDHSLLLATGVEVEQVATVEADLADNRFNDCKCDPQGRLWAGTMSKRRTPGTAALYKLERSGELVRMIGGTTISNGIGWSPTGKCMYFIDSVSQRIDVFDFDAVPGTIHNRRPFVEIEPTDGLPDGLAVDREGGVWVCLFGGGALRRYSERGKLDSHAALPVTNPTCPVFGGDSLEVLYLTSARHRLSSAQLEAEPLAGAVLGLVPGVKGMPGNMYAG